MDVVWCRFPYDGQAGRSEIPHPCLVFQVNEYKPDKFAVKVVYGTSNLTRVPKGENFVNYNHTELDYAGLYKVTLFDLGRSKWLTWGPQFFTSPDQNKYPTPVIGCVRTQGQDVLRVILEERRAKGLPCP